MSNEILPGYVCRVGPDLAIRQYNADIDNILKADFGQASANVIQIAAEISEEYAFNSDIYPAMQKQILSGAERLAKSENQTARETADKIINVVQSLFPAKTADFTPS